MFWRGIGKYILLGIWVAQTGLVVLFGVLLEHFHHVPFTFGLYLRIKLLSYLLLLPFLFGFRSMVEFFQNLYFPSGKFDRPQPVYSHAERFRLAGEFKEAILAYNELATQYPDLAKPFVAMMDIYDLEYHDTESVRKIYQRAIQTVKDPRERKILDQAYQDMTKE
ncbi:MAG: hypothetical protein ACI4SG_00615 [Oligosphaeraceae bacterium]